MSWQAIRDFKIGAVRCESTCGHFHRTPEAAAKCGYGNSGPASFTEVVRFVGSASLDYCAGDEMECQLTDGQITLIPKRRTNDE
jgi:hypothetical protein